MAHTNPTWITKLKVVIVDGRVKTLTDNIFNPYPIIVSFVMNKKSSIVVHISEYVWLQSNGNLNRYTGTGALGILKGYSPP